MGTHWDSSAGAKTLEAILLGLLDAAESSSYPPNRLLEPPPGGCNTLQEMKDYSTIFVGSYTMYLSKSNFNQLPCAGPGKDRLQIEIDDFHRFTWNHKSKHVKIKEWTIANVLREPLSLSFR